QRSQIQKSLLSSGLFAFLRPTSFTTPQKCVSDRIYRHNILIFYSGLLFPSLYFSRLYDFL
ncbi:hypothetical protein, partial [Trabulsiella odontotermitis]|uniref:hypothetical protein n=1 Tax=Trabulsiella odontotermitis TaxID=379893 RepID=UPI001EE0623C